MRSTVALILILATAATAHAGWFNSLGRHLGLGWSDGYHACDSCSRHGSHFAIPPGGLPYPEPVPVPAKQPTPAKPPMLFELPE
jgi:hypothetical protein